MRACWTSGGRARITPFFNYPPDIRKAIYTTNCVESLNRSLRKIIKTRGAQIWTHLIDPRCF